MTNAQITLFQLHRPHFKRFQGCFTYPRGWVRTPVFNMRRDPVCLDRASLGFHTTGNVVDWTRVPSFGGFRWLRHGEQPFGPVQGSPTSVDTPSMRMVDVKQTTKGVPGCPPARKANQDAHLQLTWSMSSME